MPPANLVSDDRFSGDGFLSLPLVMNPPGRKVTNFIYPDALQAAKLDPGFSTCRELHHE